MKEQGKTKPTKTEIVGETRTGKHKAQEKQSMARVGKYMEQKQLWLWL